MSQKIWQVAFILSLLSPIFAQKNGASLSLPYSIPAGKIRPLREMQDSSLQAKFERHVLQNKKWARLIANKKMTVGLVDLREPYRARFAHLNGDVMMYAASLPKIAILLASCQAIADSSLRLTPEIESDLKIMISRSSNMAATRMIDRIGFAKIEEVVTAPHYGFYDPDLGGGLWVGKRYATRGKRHPDPLKGLSHAATVYQTCRFYYLLATNRLVSEKESRHMLDILADPEINHKFVYTLSKIGPNAKLYRKSGGWRNWHADSVLVWGPERRYILVALVNDRDGEKILREFVTAAEEALDG